MVLKQSGKTLLKHATVTIILVDFFANPAETKAVKININRTEN